ncbi:MAG: DNA-binding response regulator [Sphingobacteriales bacterium]|nr:DNA-binding response regulator [Sphingobacteriales bacterium]MBI3719727.1 DNA-binding response regulator [Sphingobacteriales bacterium]
MKFILRHKLSILYGIALAVLLLVLKWLEIKFIIYDHSLEVYIGAIALLFTGLGIWLAIKLTKPQVQVVEKEVYIHTNGDFVFNEKAFEKTGMSKRELEVLELMAKGRSNQEIADALFVSLNTIKTHCSGIFFKLEVKRRTEAVETARRIGLIP